MSILIRSHTDTSGGGGLPIGEHLIDLPDVLTYSPFFESGDMTFPLPINQWAGLNQQLNEQVLSLYLSDLDVLGTIPVISDTAYDATSWNGNTDGASKNAIRDKIESIVTSIPVISDVAYNATSWNGNLDGASKNVLRDKFETLGTMSIQNADDVLITDGIIDGTIMQNNDLNSNSLLQNGFGGSVAVGNHNYFGNESLVILDTDSLQYLTIKPGSNLSANRVLTLTTGDADRTLTMAGNATISNTNTGDQTSIVGISGTKAQFNTANSDGDFVFTSDIGSTVQAYDADLATIAGLTATTDNFIVSVSSAWASRTPAQVRSTLGLVIGTNVQAYDADLTTWAGITPGTGVGTALAVNVGTAGAFVVNGGALGTPSSGALTNCTFPTLNQNTTGSAAKWTTARNLAGNSVDGSANVAFANKFIVQGTADSGLSAAQFLGALGTGILKNTTTTGVLSIAVAGDFPTLNQNTTGSAATLTTARAIYGNNFDGSAALTQVIASTYGGTGNGFAKFSGPATSEKTFTLPNVSATILTDNAAVTVAQGGTGRATSTTAYGLIAAGTQATGAHQTLAAGATTEILVGGGSSALPVWTTATGSGSPVRATSPTFVTSVVIGSDILGSGTRFVIANSGADVFTLKGQDSTHNLQMNWRYNATASAAYGEIVTWGYSNPLKIDTSVLQIGSNNPMNVKIGGTANRGTTEGTNQLVIFNGTAPVGTLTNGASFYAASGEMRVMDAAGNSTLLSPHDTETNEWIYWSKNTRTGQVLRIDMERLMRRLDQAFGGGYIKESYEFNVV